MRQSFTNWRLTVSENGPGGDAIPSILEPFLEDSRVHHTVAGRDITPGENATRALQAGNAPYVAVLHDDDRWNAEFLARRVAFLDRYATCGIVFGNARFIDSFGREFSRSKVRLHEGLQDREEFVRTLYLTNLIPVQAVLGRRSAYDKVGSEFSTIMFDDHEMWLRIACLFDVGFLGVYDSDYRVHLGQKTQVAFTKLGYHRHQFFESVDPWIPAYVTRRDKRRAHASAYLREALEAREQGQPRRAIGALMTAWRAYPAAPFDRKLGSLAIGALRTRSRWRRAWSQVNGAGLPTITLGL